MGPVTLVLALIGLRRIVVGMMISATNRGSSPVTQVSLASARESRHLSGTTRELAFYSMKGRATRHPDRCGLPRSGPDTRRIYTSEA